MDNARELYVNPLPKPTWHRCRVNDTRIKVRTEGVVPAVAGIVTAGRVTTETNLTEMDFRTMESGMGKDFDAYAFSVTPTPVYRYAKAGEDAEIDVDLWYDGKTCCFNSFRFEAADNGVLSIYMRYRTKERAEFTGGIDTRIKVGKNAHVKLIQVNETGDNRIYNNIAAAVDDNGKLEIIHVLPDGREVIDGCAVNLFGKCSCLTIDTAYDVKNDRKFDFNYVARHRGRESLCEISAKGILAKGAEKCFRTTVDFITGCVEAKGVENEDVLLLDEDAVNKTVPLILCTEEAVEGEHGATIGKLSDEILFYLNTRGIEEKMAYKLISAGRMASIINLIPKESLRKEIYEEIGSELG